MATVLARYGGRLGELVLREADDGHHEVISNGVFLMDTRDGRSERLLVTEALAAVPGDDRHVLVAGLGVGFSLGAALAAPGVARVTVVELEPAVVTLVRAATGERTGADLDDPRVVLEVGDVHDVLAAAAPASIDVLCLDVDNGPGWLVGDANRRLYDDDGLAMAAAVLSASGALAVWSAHDDADFVARLGCWFRAVATRTVPVARGEPDRVWVASGPVSAGPVSPRGRSRS